ncbi:hypothetical protein KIV40_00065 [Vibrio sp. D173a]|nr:hypothetical protein [Vibrio sp. D173a]
MTLIQQLTFSKSTTRINEMRMNKGTFPDYASLIEQLAMQACQGLVFGNYNKRFQASIDELLKSLPDDKKEKVISIAEKHGYKKQTRIE